MTETRKSGIEWIGEIPNHWSIGRLKNSVSSSRNGVWGDEAKGNKYDCYCIRVADFDRDNLIVKAKEFTIRNINISNVNEVLLKRDDLLIEKSGGGDKQPVGAVVQYTLPYPAVYANFIAKLSVNKGVANSSYLKYLHGTLYNQGLTKRSIKQTTGIQNLDLKSYLNEAVVFPPLYEQVSIGNFLNQKTSEIDTLIEDKEKLIQLLEEKRQAIITEAVTKGLDPDVQMKGSGVEWIGEIPEHWTTSKIKYLSNHHLIYGANASAELDDEDLPRYIRITDIDKNGDLRDETFKSLTKDIASKYPLKKGDILFARSGATVGKTYIHQENSISTYAGYLIKFQSDTNKINPKFLYYYTKSFYYEKWIEANTIQATIENISAEKYKNMLIPYPPTGEQHSIVEFLESHTADNYALLKELENQIHKLKEYRQALIYEAVTGKIDVQEMLKETEQEEVSSS